MSRSIREADSIGKCRVEQLLVDGATVATATSEHFELQCQIGVVPGGS